ncbi:hypothetical protein D918_07874 [Trichuris suis]|nr:hypothetical protein D918_07874 [Trichuris suis]
MTVGTNVAKTGNNGAVWLPVVPVIVSRDGRSVSTYALIDPGSEGTLITDQLVRQLCLSRKPCDVLLSTFHGRDPQFELTSVSFNISGSDGQVYEVGLLWATNDGTLPDNRNEAMKRFISLRKRTSADDELRGSYAKAISELIHLGIARKVDQKELRLPAGRIWYLPHHAVRHPARPNKVRIVFDASSVCEGVSLNNCSTIHLRTVQLLNNCLRKGPHLLS